MVTADGQVRYDPPTDQVGAFRCTYEVTNSQGLRASASIIVSVREPLLTNEPPIAADDTLTVEVGAVEFEGRHEQRHRIPMDRTAR